MATGPGGWSVRWAFFSPESELHGNSSEENCLHSSSCDGASGKVKRISTPCYGELMGDRRELGLPMSVPDGQIAAIARRDHLAIATRNVLDFEHCGIEVINPFEFTP